MRRWQQSRFFDDAFRDRHAGIGEPHGGVIGFRSDGPPNALGKLGQRVAEQLRDIALPARSGRREGNAGYHQVLDEPWKIRPDPSTRSDKAAARRRPVGFQDFLNRRALTMSYRCRQQRRKALHVSIGRHKHKGAPVRGARSVHRSADHGDRIG